jgi:hypothetical protein
MGVPPAPAGQLVVGALGKKCAEYKSTFSIVICSKNKDDVFEEGYESEAPKTRDSTPRISSSSSCRRSLPEKVFLYT